MTFVEKVIYKVKQLIGGYLLRNPEDLLALDYIKQDKINDFRHRYDILPGDIIFDLGAYEGSWCDRIMSMYPESQIHIFELLPKYAEGLLERYSPYNNVIVNDFGLSAYNAEVKISEDGLSSSAINHNIGTKIHIGKIKLFDDYLISNAIPNIKLLKMNIEGGKYDLLEHIIRSNWINQIENIQIQFHNYGQEFVQRRDAIRENLSKTHYLTYDYVWTFENWRMIEGTQ